MTVLTEITTAPTAPSRNDPTNFRARADAYVDWQSSAMVPQINAIVAILNDAMPDLWLGTSTTSMAIGTGSKSFTVAEDLLFFGVGTAVRISDTAAPMTNYMNGVVTAYNGSTGAMTVSVSTAEGSGTKTAWSITPEVPIPLLGTVATYAVTTSTTDTTANRITKVGDAGILGNAVTTTDWDVATGGGVVYMGNNATNAPIINWVMGTYHRHNSTYGTQIAESLTLTPPRKFMRSNVNGTWTAWVEFYHSGNQLYTVVATATTMVAHRPYAVNTSSAAVTMTLPASATAGDWVEIVDAAGTFHTYNCTVARNGHNIMGLAENLIADEQNAAFKLVYVDATYGWRLA